MSTISDDGCEFFDALEDPMPPAKSDVSFLPSMCPSPSESLVSPFPLKYYAQLLDDRKNGAEDALRLATKKLSLEFDSEDVRNVENKFRLFDGEGTCNGQRDALSRYEGESKTEASTHDVEQQKEIEQSFCAIENTPASGSLNREMSFHQSEESTGRTRRRKRSLLKNVLTRKKADALKSDFVIPPLSRADDNSKMGHKFGGIRLLQEIQTSNVTPIWSLGFSHQSTHLAIGSQDGFVRIYETTNDAKLLQQKATFTLQGHEATVVALAWGFVAPDVEVLATTGLDKTLRIWDPFRGQLLCSVQCSDWPVALAFHPSVPGRILTGNLGATVQVWSFKPGHPATGTKPRVDVIEYLQVADLVTALAVSPNGKTLAIGNRSGRLSLFDGLTLKFRLEIDCRNKRGRNSRGRKITGIVWSSDSRRICVSTNDSRIRLIDLNNVSTFTKFKGHTNERYMLKAHFSNDETFIVCPSENNWVYSWDGESPGPEESLRNSVFERKGANRKSDSFKGSDELITAFCLVPSHLFGAIETSLARRSPIGSERPNIDFVCVLGSVKGRLRIFANVQGAVL
eukprot:GHVP01027791.1.p1 GENE.GHVP01027791.1~~GHVP01027791.1.p1  ORF type:complete len:569 (+),score=95.07 GHVP01027791.1:135-1841(+)